MAGKIFLVSIFYGFSVSVKSLCTELPALIFYSIV